jgi:hypothetical protein
MVSIAGIIDILNDLSLVAKGLCLSVFAMVLVTFRFLISKRKTSTRERSMSFNSEVMLGSFPEDAEVKQPWINILLQFYKCPSEEDTIDAFNLFLKQERMTSTITPNSNGKGFIFKQVEVDLKKDLLKTIEVKDEKELMSIVDDMCNTDPCDISNNGTPMSQLPPWRVYRLINKGNGVSVLFIRVHHVLGDGIALINTIGTIFKDSRTGEALNYTKIAESMTGGRSPRSNNDKKMGKDIFTMIHELLACIWSGLQVLQLPLSRYDSRNVFFPDKRSTLKMNTKRKTVVLPVVELSFMKKIKSSAGVTLNDVVLSATAGMMRRYCAAKGDSSPTSKFMTLQNRALVPVAFPRSSEELSNPITSLRNKWAFASMAFPVRSNTAVDRLQEAHRMSKRIKNSPIVLMQYIIQTYILPWLPTFLRQKTAYDLFTRHSMVFSNLPGSPVALSCCNESLIGVQVIFPNILPQALMISYNGKMFFNLSLNADQFKEMDEQLLGVYYLEELYELAEEYGIPVSQKEVVDPNAQHLRG